MDIADERHPLKWEDVAKAVKKSHKAPTAMANEEWADGFRKGVELVAMHISAPFDSNMLTQFLEECGIRHSKA
jgi:hypothetical protein